MEESWSTQRKPPPYGQYLTIAPHGVQTRDFLWWKAFGNMLLPKYLATVAPEWYGESV